MADRIEVALIGCGRMGSIHARNAYNNPRIHLKYIVERDPAKHAKLLETFPGTQLTSEYSVALSDTTLRGVIVCTPTLLHPEHILQALKAGKAVFCEKPIGLNEDDIKACFDTAAQLNLPLLCGYQRRFDDSLVKIKEMTESTIGKAQLIRMTSRDHPPPPEAYLTAPSSGSFFDDFSTHDVDVARWITGEDPELIYGTASSFLGPALYDDTAVVVLKFPSGALCVIDNSRQTTYGYDVRLEALGPKGMATLTNPPVSSVIFSAQHGHTVDVAPFSFPQRFAQAYNSEVNHWLDLIEGKAQPKVTAHDCIQAARITAAAQAARLNQVNASTVTPIPKHQGVYPTVPEGETIGVVVIGTGRMGRVRAQAMRPLARVQVLYAFDIIEASVQSFAKDFNCEGQVLTDESLAKALSDPRVKLAVISTTSSSHYSLISAALNAGKHVFCEKPLALTAEHTEACVNLAREKNLALYCGFQRRSDNHFRHLKKSIKGQIQLVRVTSRESSGNSTMAYLLASGGFLFDSVIHDFDMACYITDEYPIEVFCQGTAFNPQLKEVGDVDSIVIILRFPSGIIASIDNHRNAVYGYDQRVEVHTSTGAYSAENLGFSTVKVSDERGFSTDNPPDFLNRYDQAYRDETVHFISLLTGQETTPRSTFTDYPVTAKIAEAAARSLKTGKPVTLC